MPRQPMTEDQKAEFVERMKTAKEIKKQNQPSIEEQIKPKTKKVEEPVMESKPKTKKVKQVEESIVEDEVQLESQKAKLSLYTKKQLLDFAKSRNFETIKPAMTKQIIIDQLIEFM